MRTMKVRLALKKLRAYYPLSVIRTRINGNHRAIIKDGKFMAWIVDGVADTTLLPEIWE